MELTQEQQYTKGFNHGYGLAKHKPELLKLIEKAVTDKTQYGQGVLHGRAQYRMEKMKNKLKISPDKNRSQAQQQTRIKGKQK